MSSGPVSSHKTFCQLLSLQPQLMQPPKDAPPLPHPSEVGVSAADTSLQEILERIDEAVVVLSAERRICFANAAAELMLGEQMQRFVSPHWKQNIEQTPGFNTSRLTIGNLSPASELNPYSLESTQRREQDSVELFLVHPQAPQGIWLSATERPLGQGVGSGDGSLIICRDITQHKQVEDKLLHDAFHDRLTGLPNRNFLLRQLESAIQLRRQTLKHEFSVLFLDLDRFKVINESLGPVAGDHLLILVANRLRHCLREEDIIVRLGGDEFSILLLGVKEPSYSEQVAERIHQELLSPFSLDGHEVFADVSIGIVNSCDAYEQPEEILRDADIAMHRAKEEGKAGSQTFTKAMHVKAVKLLHLENDIRRAVDRKEFQVHYQPIIALNSRAIVGFEALVRWRHPLRGLVGPGEFIPMAEETGIIKALGLWVLQESCAQMRLWQLQFPQAKNWTISVNISGRQLIKPHFIDSIEQVLHETGLNPCNLKLEITESVLLNNSRLVIDILRHLRKLGIQLAMDDFGTGYSSMSYLLDFPFNTLKIDRSFIKSMEHSSKKLGVVRSIIAMSSNLEMKVIAEGIETANHLAQLKVLNCGYGQGFLFSKALEPQAAETFINSEMIATQGQPDAKAMELIREETTKERLLLYIENLQQELEDIKQEKSDLEILLDNATEHACLVESELEREINDYQKTEAELQKANEVLENLSTLDALTQLANRRRFDEYLSTSWQQLEAVRGGLSLILIDVDYFKDYNDNYGHQAGDDCLIQLAEAMQATVAESEDALVARYGGEEFAIVLPHTHAGEAVNAAESLRFQLRNLKIPHARSSVSPWVTVSLGIVSLVPTLHQSPGALVALADRALYEAKSQGRDRFILFSS